MIMACVVEILMILPHFVFYKVIRIGQLVLVVPNSFGELQVKTSSNREFSSMRMDIDVEEGKCARKLYMCYEQTRTQKKSAKDGARRED